MMLMLNRTSPAAFPPDRSPTTQTLGTPHKCIRHVHRPTQCLGRRPRPPAQTTASHRAGKTTDPSRHAHQSSRASNPSGGCHAYIRAPMLRMSMHGTESNHHSSETTPSERNTAAETETQKKTCTCISLPFCT